MPKACWEYKQNILVGATELHNLQNQALELGFSWELVEKCTPRNKWDNPNYLKGCMNLKKLIEGEVL